MIEFLRKVVKSIKIYHRYFNEALLETYFYFTSAYPAYIFLKKWSLANRNLRILWAPPKPGRKPIHDDVVKLILRLKELNPKWGAQKISDELKKVGHQVCKKTVLKYLEINGLNSPGLRSGPSWSEFLDNHKFKIGIDFTSLISLMGHQLFIFIILDLDSRKLVFINVTYNPSFEWVKQQFRNAFDIGEYPTLCISDNDPAFGINFESMLKNYFEMKLKRTPYRSPWKNGRVERFHLSLTGEAFEGVVPINLNQTIRVCREYQNYYNNHRPHQGLNGNLPGDLKKISPSKVLLFEEKEHFGGKIISFEPSLAA